MSLYQILFCLIHERINVSISDSDTPDDLRLPVKCKTKNIPQRRASDNSPKRSMADLVGI